MGEETRSQPGGEAGTPGGKEEASAVAAISWRRVLLAVLIAGAAFLILLVLQAVLYEIAYVSSIVFLVAGLWLGRRSQSPWAEGAVFGLLGGLLACLILLVVAFPLWWGGLLLALPQGVAGTWLGARLWPARGADGPPPETPRAG